MDYTKISDTNIEVSPIGLGTWVMGGWMWGGADENDALDAIEVSVEGGVNLIDTAPIYGFGKAETIVGKFLKKLNSREKIIISTKFGLEWDDNGRINRNCSKRRVLSEIDDSLKRLQTDYIDIYHVHWPDSKTPIEETLSVLSDLKDSGKIRSIGLSNFSIDQLKNALSLCKIDLLQPPFNMFNQHSKQKLIPYCEQNNISVLTYSSLCSGMLTGKFSKTSVFPKGDLRKFDRKFKGESFIKYLAVVDELKKIASQKGVTITQLAIEWTINQQGVDCALIGARNRRQAQENIKPLSQQVFRKDDFDKVDKILAKTKSYEK